MDPEVCGRQRKRGERVGARAGNRCDRQRDGVVGDEVQQELGSVDAADRLAAAEQANDGEAHVDEDGPPGQEVQAREQILRLQAQRKPRCQRARDARQASPGPALLLGDVGGRVLGSEAARQHVRHVRRAPALLVEVDRELEVLGQRVRGEPADALERLAAEQHVGAAAEDGVEPVLAAGDGSEEQRLLRPGRGGDAIVLGVGVVLRRLDERDLGVVHPPERGLEEARVRHVVGVEHGDERGVGLRQGVVDVARPSRRCAPGAGCSPRRSARRDRASRRRCRRRAHGPSPPRPRRPTAAATVRSTMSSGSLYTGMNTSTATRLGRCALLAHPLVGDGPPEAERLA